MISEQATTLWWADLEPVVLNKKTAARVLSSTASHLRSAAVMVTYLFLDIYPWIVSTVKRNSVKFVSRNSKFNSQLITQSDSRGFVFGEVKVDFGATDLSAAPVTIFQFMDHFTEVFKSKRDTSDMGPPTISKIFYQNPLLWGVTGASEFENLGIDGNCMIGDYSTAVATCYNNGARLCTKEEVESGCV